MMTLWTQTRLLALLPLMLAFFGLSTDVYASSSKQPTQTISGKKAAAPAVRKPSAKKPQAKSTRTATRRAVQSSKAVNRTTVVPRKNLRSVSHTERDSSNTGSRIHVGLRHNNQNNIATQQAEGHTDTEPLTTRAMLRSEVAFVQDLDSSAILYDKNSDEVRPIASISKLMTALVIAEADQPMNQILRISDADVDRVRHSRSRLRVGYELSRADMLHLALMSSENRASHALARYYPGGMPAFIRAMNDKARSLGMRKTHFVEPTGLSSENVSAPRDLVKLLQAASKQPLIHRYTTDDQHEVEITKGRQLVYNNTNRLVKNTDWNIQISKTGFINEAGECLVMLTRIDNREVAIILLNSTGRYSRIGDAVRIRSLVKNENNLAML